MKLIQMKKKQTKSEFERESIPKSKLKNWKSFLGMYAGEHAAGTEFMIGPLFLTVGVSAFDLLAGLLLGNLLAVFWLLRPTSATESLVLEIHMRFPLYLDLKQLSADSPTFSH